MCKDIGERLKEHLRPPSPIYGHANTSGHHTKLDNFSIVGRESYTIARTFKEAMFIRINDLSLTRNMCKYQLLHIWDEVLFSTLTSTSNRLYLPGQPDQLKKASNTSPSSSQGNQILCLHHQHLVGMGSCNITNSLP